ncbi:hypothetical protein BDR07DRAFT_1430965, partial [Suillus spraguei]
MHHSLLAVISALTALTFMSVSATPAVFSRDDQCLPFESKCSTDPGAQPCCQPFQCVTLLANRIPSTWRNPTCRMRYAKSAETESV